MTENRPLTVGLLREKWGFDGIFMSDWNATYSAVGAANGDWTSKCRVPAS